MAKYSFKMREGEQLFAGKVNADCWKMPQIHGSRQMPGKVWFTNQRIIFRATERIGMTAVSWEIAMTDIAAVKGCVLPKIFPLGMLITMKNGDRYRLFMFKRSSYIHWISEHISS